MASCSHVPFPDKLDLSDDRSRAADWELFEQVWTNYEISSGLLEKDKKLRTATLLTCFSKSALQAFNSLSFDSEGDKQDIEIVMDKMRVLCVGQTNETYERYLFNMRVQKPDENFDHFYAAVLKIASNCNFGNLHDSLIRDRLIVGVTDQATRKKLLYERELTLKKTLEICRTYEITTARLQSMDKDMSHGTDAVVGSVNKSNNPAKKKYQKRNFTAQSTFQSTQNRVKGHTSSDSACSYCGRGTHDRKRCPARNADCRKCGTRGHYAAVCRSSQTSKSKVTNVHGITQDDKPEAFLGFIGQGGQSGYVNLSVDGTTLRFHVDTGADVNVISSDVYEKHFRDKILTPLQRVLRGPDRKLLSTLGSFQANIESQNNHTQAEVCVIAGNGLSLLGRDTSCNLELVSFNVGSIEDYPQLFKGLGEMPHPYKLQLKDNAKPYSVPIPRRIAIPLLPRVKDELERLESLNVIRKVTEPTDWCAPIVVVPKKDGSVRICCDFTKLNESVKRE
ncbi:uncharacterized protein LOC100366740 [Saccoglossus kowalevskii]|uniref:Uncharacterized protein LOC100366740 n=1 Tax=Saccoglossus kowalevskii TaxID=10224 RepID=A0ABM0LWL6_SACKO|nr:PREDICTED: uncharacterized protein LOC100366740 [Saccoglossus kowalevskii]